MRANLTGWRQQPGTKISVTITSYRRQAITDHANLVGGCKGLVDALVNTGILIDDQDGMVDIKYNQAPSRLSPIGKGKDATVIEWEVES